MNADEIFAGLCGACVHCKPSGSGRGGVFHRCLRHDTDAAYPKYPRLPMLRCDGHQRPEEG